MTGSAVFDDTGAYRYRLRREFGEGPPMMFVMLNPSTADHERNDPTITRCCGFAKREGAGSLWVGNLHALRSTDPKALARAEHPDGPDNDRHLMAMADETVAARGSVVVAWGAHTFSRARARYVATELFRPLQLMCLGTTKDGSPRHPLYIAGNQPLIPWPVP